MGESIVTEEITQKQIGYSWKIDISRTRKIVTEAKYPDTEEVKGQLTGNTDTVEEANLELLRAKKDLERILDNA